MRRLSLFIGGLVLIGACTEAPAPDATGQQIFEQICSRCHGVDLGGGIGPPLGSGSNSAEQDDAFLVLTISRGRGRMPSFNGTLSEEQVARVVEYVRSRQE
ncbi:MAG: c-type cytochrome [Actinomycetota bacterium]